MSSDDRTTVDDVMSTPLETIVKDATVMEAAQRMREKDISALVVPHTPRAIISSTDVIAAVVFWRGKPRKVGNGGERANTAGGRVIVGVAGFAA